MTEMLREDVIATLSEGITIEVCDVGANPIGGAAPYQSLLDRGLARLTGFEPQPDAFRLLQERKSLHETYLPTVVGDGNPARLHIYTGSGFASCFAVDPITRETLVPLKSYTRLRETALVDTARLDDLDAVPAIDYLKIDVQGSELAVIANGRAKLASALAVQTEVRFFPLYQEEPSFAELHGELISQGFQLHDFASLTRFRLASSLARRTPPRLRRQLLDGDAIYVRDLRRADAFDNCAFRRLALLAILVFDAADLALFCVDHLARRGEFDSALLEAWSGTL